MKRNTSINRKASERCYLPINDSVLERLAKIAAEDRADFFHRKPKWGKLYRDRVLCIALCQGAALHFIDGCTGIKDWDVWTFYWNHKEAPFPYRRRAEKAYGDPVFGIEPNRPKYIGRCVDLIGRSIHAYENEDPAKALRRYLTEKKTNSAKKLAEKAVVLLYPTERRGEIIWPITSNV